MTMRKRDISLSEFQRCQVQLSVFKYMAAGCSKDSIRYFELSEIAEEVAAEEKDVQRSLFVLEGHKLVSPMPPGNLTSRTWCLTETGMAASRSLNQNNMNLL